MGEADAAPDVDCIIYDPASRRVFTSNADSHSATAIDQESGKNVGTILGGGPEFAVADGQRMIYNNLEDKSVVLAVDSRPPGSKVALANCAGRSASVNRDGSRTPTAVPRRRKPALLVVMNVDDGKVIQSFPISNGAEVDVYHPKTGLVFVSTRQGWVHIFHEALPTTTARLAK